MCKNLILLKFLRLVGEVLDLSLKLYNFKQNYEVVKYRFRQGVTNFFKKGHTLTCFRKNNKSLKKRHIFVEGAVLTNIKFREQFFTQNLVKNKKENKNLF